MRILWLMMILLVAGCATNSLEKRKSEKRSAYQALKPEWRALVDGGLIQEGMSEDAVYIALGEPALIFTVEEAQGPAAKWLYKETYLQETEQTIVRRDSFTTLRSYDPFGGSTAPMQPRVEKQRAARSYMKLEVDFVNGVVKSWRTRPPPR